MVTGSSPAVVPSAAPPAEEVALRGLMALLRALLPEDAPDESGR